MTELLKQGQYSPKPVEQQIVRLLAGNEGLLRDIPVANIGQFATDLDSHFVNNVPELLAEILEKGTFKKSDLKDRIIAAIEAFKTNWS
jgi:F-type H+-transporting ATPase subunit alpha